MVASPPSSPSSSSSRSTSSPSSSPSSSSKSVSVSEKSASSDSENSDRDEDKDSGLLSFADDDIELEPVNEKVLIRKQATRTLEVSEIHTTSLTLHWRQVPRPILKITGYRISVNNVDDDTGYEVSVENTKSTALTHRVIDLKPGTAYRFHVAAINDNHNVIINNTNQVSEVVFTKLKTYISAWYFEHDEDLISSFSYFLNPKSEEKANENQNSSQGSPVHFNGKKKREEFMMMAEDICRDVVLRWKVWRSPLKSYCGYNSLLVKKFRRYECGIFTDFRAVPKRNYIMHIQLYINSNNKDHETRDHYKENEERKNKYSNMMADKKVEDEGNDKQEKAKGEKESEAGREKGNEKEMEEEKKQQQEKEEKVQIPGIKLLVWDFDTMYSASLAESRKGKWYHLSVEFIGGKKSKNRCMILPDDDFIGDFFVDAVEIGYSQAASEVETLATVMKLSRVGVDIPTLAAASSGNGNGKGEEKKVMKQEYSQKDNKKPNFIVEGLRKDTFSPQAALYLKRPVGAYTHPLLITLVNVENPNNLDYTGTPLISSCLCRVYWNKEHVGDVELDSQSVTNPLWREDTIQKKYTLPLQVHIDEAKRKISLTRNRKTSQANRRRSSSTYSSDGNKDKNGDTGNIDEDDSDDDSENDNNSDSNDETPSTLSPSRSRSRSSSASSKMIPEMQNGRNELIIRIYDTTEVPLPQRKKVGFKQANSDSLKMLKGFQPVKKFNYRVKQIPHAYERCSGQVKLTLDQIASSPACKIMHIIDASSGSNATRNLSMEERKAKTSSTTSYGNETHAKLGLIIRTGNPRVTSGKNKTVADIGKHLQIASLNGDAHSALLQMKILYQLLESCTSINKKSLANYSVNENESDQRFAGVEAATQSSKNQTSNDELAYKLRLDILSMGILDEILPLVDSDEGHKLACNILASFLTYPSSERIDDVCRMMCQNYLKGLGVLHGLHAWLTRTKEDFVLELSAEEKEKKEEEEEINKWKTYNNKKNLQPSQQNQIVPVGSLSTSTEDEKERQTTSNKRKKEVDIASVRLLWALYHKNRISFHQDTEDYPLIFEIIRSNLNRTEYARKFFVEMASGKEIPFQVVQAYERARVDGSIPMAPGLWKSKAAIKMMTEGIVVIPKFYEPTFIEQVTTAKSWNERITLIAAQGNYLLQESKKFDEKLAKSMTKMKKDFREKNKISSGASVNHDEEDVDEFGRNFKKDYYQGIPKDVWWHYIKISSFALTLLVFLILGQMYDRVQYNPRGDHGCQPYPISKIIKAEAWLIFFLSLSVFWIRNIARKEVVTQIMRPCIVWMSLLAFACFIVWVVGIFYLALTEKDNCPGKVYNTALALIWLMSIGMIVSLLRYCCFAKGKQYLRQIQYEKERRMKLNGIPTSSEQEESKDFTAMEEGVL